MHARGREQTRITGSRLANEFEFDRKDKNKVANQEQGC